ncbi:retrovirus-related pol polyprotein from transposon TNT 1-94 [Tanacetum coccineum]|uniref:Retrovirus-related pol polyprotein from transposon TNT 1-94 n=1 Tax=Tanacetum coccineum TaxID=301880 RepID=A0ABQ5DPV6_9ASTR
MRRTDADFSHAPPNEYSPSPDDKKQWSLVWFDFYKIPLCTLMTIEDVRATSCFRSAKIGDVGCDPIVAITYDVNSISCRQSAILLQTSQLRNSSKPRQQATINDGRVTLQPVPGRANFFCYGQLFRILTPLHKKMHDVSVIEQGEKPSFQNPFYLKKAQQLEPKLYDGNVIKSTSAIVIPDSEETLMLTERESAPNFDQYFELNELKAQSQEKDTVTRKLKERIKSLNGNINKDKVKKDIEEIETINIELDHMVSKLIAENKHLKQTYQQLYDSIKPTRIRSKEQCDALINQVNQKSVEISDLNVSHQEKDLVVTTLNDELRKLKGKYLVDNVVTKHTIAPEMLKVDVETVAHKLLNNMTAHSDYLRHTQEQAVILKEVVEQGKSQNPLNNSLDSAYSKLNVNSLAFYVQPKILMIPTNNKEPSKSWGSIVSDVPSSSLDECRLGMLRSQGFTTWKDLEFTYSKLEFCDSTFEVALLKHICFIRNLEGVDLLTGSRDNNLYTLSLRDMMVSSPICILSKASKTKSWLWHRRLSHLNFGAINHLARHGLLRGLPKLKF